MTDFDFASLYGYTQTIQPFSIRREITANTEVKIDIEPAYYYCITGSTLSSGVAGADDVVLIGFQSGDSDRMLVCQLGRFNGNFSSVPWGSTSRRGDRNILIKSIDVNSEVHVHGYRIQRRQL